MKKHAPIFSSFFESHVWIRPEGRGTFLESPVIKEFVDRCLEEGAESFVIDLEACPAMDSTFMGMLAGLGLGFRKSRKAKLAIVGTSPKTLASLKELGLHHLLVIEPKEGDWVGRLEEARSNLMEIDLKGQADHQTHIRKSHEDLCVADKKNRKKFATVLEMTGSKMAASKGH